MMRNSNFANCYYCLLLFLASNDITLGVWLMGVAFVPEISFASMALVSV